MFQSPLRAKVRLRNTARKNGHRNAAFFFLFFFFFFLFFFFPPAASSLPPRTSMDLPRKRATLLPPAVVIPCR